VGGDAVISEHYTNRKHNRLPIISNNPPIPCFDSGHLSLANSRSSGKELEDKLIDLKMRLLVGWYVLSHSLTWANATSLDWAFLFSHEI